MRLLTHALTVLYGTAGIVLIGAAKAADDRHATGWSLLLLGCAVVAGVAVLHHSVLRAEVRAVRHQLERAARPPGMHPAEVAAEIRRGLTALATACCLTAALTDGTDHDPDTCTRKADQ